MANQQTVDPKRAPQRTGVPSGQAVAGRVIRYSVIQPGQGSMAGFPTLLASPGFAGVGQTRYDTYYQYDQAGNRTSLIFGGGGASLRQ